MTAMNAACTMNLVQFNDSSILQNDDTKIIQASWQTELPTKTGEIFRNHDGQYSFMCYHCGFICEDLNDIVNHCESHFKEEKFDAVMEFAQCADSVAESFCSSPARETTTSTVKSRKRTTSSIGSESITNSIQRPKRLNVPSNIPQNCPICNEWCNDYLGHIKKVHHFKSRIYECFMCQKLFKEIRGLRRHIRSTKHAKRDCYQCAMEPSIKHPSEPRRHKCLFCNEWFPNHIEFKVHFKDAHDKNADYFFDQPSNCKIFTCYICERDFPYRHYLVSHMKCHNDKYLEHQCTTCGRRFRTFGRLTEHLKRHDGKTYTCDECGKVFPYYERLRIHRETHTTELNFKCTECPKAFKRRKYLNLHKAVHVNAKKYACKYCDATFNFTSGRRGHEKTFHKAL